MDIKKRLRKGIKNDYYPRSAVELFMDALSEIERLESAFRHVHINNHVDDACKRCGLDIRSGVHSRAQRTREEEDLRRQVYGHY